jgi:hypothetical protein
MPDAPRRTFHFFDDLLDIGQVGPIGPVALARHAGAALAPVRLIDPRSIGMVLDTQPRP